ncbi:MAG: ferritin-like domain-containing protein [Planctomycetota bacterium]|jgi:rubrerythrin
MEVDSKQHQLLELAIARELEAYHFYTALSENVISKKIGRIFEELAAEELEHKKRLELEVLKRGHVLPPYEKVSPIKHSLFIPDLKAKLDLDYKDVLLLGIEKEQASFESYVNLLATTKDPEVREMLTELAEEEVRHKLRFESEYEILMKNG